MIIKIMFKLGEQVMKYAILLFISVYYLSCFQQNHAGPTPDSQLANDDTPVLWAGHGQFIRLSEFLNEPQAFIIFTIALDANGDPIDGEYIDYAVTKSPDGATWTLHNQKITDTRSGYGGSYVGVAMNPSFSGSEKGVYEISVTHSNNTKEIWVQIWDDEESSDISGFTHETYNSPSGDEIPGDGWEGGTSTETKQVYIELDYMATISSSIDAVIAEATTILETGGFDVTFITSDELTVDDALRMFTQFSDNDDGRKKMRKVLKNNRNFNTYLHAILATDHYEGYYGKTIQYKGAPPDGEGWTHFDCFAGATGLFSDILYQQNHKDSTGVLVFLDNLPPSSGTWTKTRMIAWTLSHEIGHALGINDHFNNSVMAVQSFTNSYSNYDQFNGPELNQSKSVSVNTRDILGRDNIDTSW